MVRRITSHHNGAASWAGIQEVASEESPAPVREHQIGDDKMNLFTLFGPNFSGGQGGRGCVKGLITRMLQELADDLQDVRLVINDQNALTRVIHLPASRKAEDDRVKVKAQGVCSRRTRLNAPRVWELIDRGERIDF